jgi:hypothetical protein
MQVIFSYIINGLDNETLVADISSVEQRQERPMLIDPVGSRAGRNMQFPNSSKPSVITTVTKANSCGGLYCKLEEVCVTWSRLDSNSSRENAKVSHQECRERDVRTENGFTSFVFLPCKHDIENFIKDYVNLGARL